MTIPTEPIGSIPRPVELMEAIDAAGDDSAPQLDSLYKAAIKDTVDRFEATGSPVITDGEQRKYHNFWTYCVHGAPNVSQDGFKIPFAAGHTRRMHRLTAGPFRYQRMADRYLESAQRYATKPVKQAVISPSALSLMYPAEDIPGYPRQEFIDDLLREHETEIRRCLDKGAHKVQVDFTEGRLAVKLDPSGNLLNSFIGLNNLALSKFTEEERKRIGVHTCPGGDRDSTHSADVDYAELLPSLFELRVGNFYIALAIEKDQERVLKIIKKHMKPNQMIFVGVIATIDPHVETPEEVRDRVLQAAKYIPIEQLGTTDDCGYSPFCDALSTTRDVAVAQSAPQQTDRRHYASDDASSAGSRDAAIPTNVCGSTGHLLPTRSEPSHCVARFVAALGGLRNLSALRLVLVWLLSELRLSKLRLLLSAGILFSRVWWTSRRI